MLAVAAVTASLLIAGRVTGDAAAVDALAEEVRRLEVEDRHSSANTQMRQHLITAYNNYGVALANAGRVDDGIAQLRKGIALDAQALALRRNLAQLLTQRAQQLMASRKHREAQALLDEARGFDDQLAAAWALLGLIHYEAQRFPEAERTWTRALELTPQDQALQERLARLRQERGVEQSFQKLSQTYFEIRYADGLRRDAEYRLQEILADARRVVGQDFGHYPSQRVTVLLYQEAQFRKLREDAPEWLGGQYDGKVRLPLVADPSSRSFQRLVWHEYTHVVVQELARGRCPTWLNEGLAEYEGNRHEPSAFTWLRRALTEESAMPLTRLHERFDTLRDPQEAALAYEQSHSLVQYLAERYGFWRFKRLLKTLGADTPFDQAFYAEFHLRLPDLEKRWTEWACASLGVSP